MPSPEFILPTGQLIAIRVGNARAGAPVPGPARSREFVSFCDTSLGPMTY